MTVYNKIVNDCRTCKHWTRILASRMGKCEGFDINKPDVYTDDDNALIVASNFDSTKFVTNEQFYCRAHSAEQE